MAWRQGYPGRPLIGAQLMNKRATSMGLRVPARSHPQAHGHYHRCIPSVGPRRPSRLHPRCRLWLLADVVMTATQRRVVMGTQQKISWSITNGLAFGKVAVCRIASPEKIRCFKKIILLKCSWFTVLYQFLHTEKWVSYMSRYTYTLFFIFFSWFITGDWIQFAVLYSRNLLFIHLIHFFKNLFFGPAQPGIKPIPPAMLAWSPNHWTTRLPVSFYYTFTLLSSASQGTACVPRY